jgi:hypothetical protein
MNRDGCQTARFGDDEPHEDLQSPGVRKSIGKPFLLHNHKDVLAVDHVPIAPLTVPVPVLVRMPIRIVPVIVRVHRSAAHPVHHLSGV